MKVNSMADFYSRELLEKMGRDLYGDELGEDPEIEKVNRLKKIERRKRMITHEELESRFTYHAPKDGQPERYERIRYKAKMLAAYINEQCPESREKSIALTKIDEAVMWANAAIARHE